MTTPRCSHISSFSYVSIVSVVILLLNAVHGSRTFSVSVSPSLLIAYWHNVLAAISTSILYILVIYIRCKLKLTNSFVMVVWLWISLLMLTLFVCRTKYFSFCLISVVVSLSEHTLLLWFVFLNDQSESRRLSPHAVYKCVLWVIIEVATFAWKVLTFLLIHYWSQFPGYTVFLMRGHLLLASKEAFEGFWPYPVFEISETGG